MYVPNSLTAAVYGRTTPLPPTKQREPIAPTTVSTHLSVLEPLVVSRPNQLVLVAQAQLPQAHDQVDAQEQQHGMHRQVDASVRRVMLVTEPQVGATHRQAHHRRHGDHHHAPSLLSCSTRGSRPLTKHGNNNNNSRSNILKLK